MSKLLNSSNVVMDVMALDEGRLLNIDNRRHDIPMPVSKNFSQDKIRDVTKRDRLKSLMSLGEFTLGIRMS